MPILKIKARKTLNSRGEAAIETDVTTDIGLLRASISMFFKPEELENAKSKKDLVAEIATKAVSTINDTIAPELLRSQLEICQQQEIDELMNDLDGTPDKSELGVNAILAVSIACCKAGAAKKGLPLYRYIAQLAENNEFTIPVPCFNVINGGNAAPNNQLVCQEFTIVPTGAEDFADAVKMSYDVYREIEKQLADEEELKPPLDASENGAFSPDVDDDKAALTLINDAIQSAGHDGKIKIAIDMNASNFCKEGLYDLEYKDDEDTDPDDYLEADAMKEMYTELLEEFPALFSIEDPFDQEDWESWPTLADQKIQIVSDLLTSMDIERVEEAVENNAANCLLVRLAQIGTVTEAINCVKLAKLSGWDYIVTMADSQTEDTFIADFAVGLSTKQFVGCALGRGESMAKCNQILRIQEELSQDAPYAGKSFTFNK